jgi:iron complex outermembrane receptor protein
MSNLDEQGDREMRKSILKSRAGYVLGLAAGLFILASSTSAFAAPVSFNVPKSDLKAALDKFISQSGVSLFYRVDDVQSKATEGVQGTMEPEDALAKLLQGNALSFVKDANGAMVISKASDTSQVTSEAAPEVIAEVVVTAEKRSNSAQKTAIAMNVFDSSTLKRNGISSLQDLANLSPSIQFAQNQDAAVITIRGVASRDDSEVGDPAVAVDTDGFYVQRPVGLNATMFDLERVEALKGPQGTLYGRNATGGVINIIAQKPKSYFEASASVDIGNYSTRNVEAMVNFPLTDTLSLRLSGTSRLHDGYLKRTPVEDADDEDNQAGRAMLLWKPNDRFNLLVTAESLHQGGVGPQGAGLAIVNDSSGEGTTLRPSLPKSSYTAYSDLNGYLNVDSQTYKVSANYAFDGVTLTYLGGLNKMSFHRLNDLDATEGYSEGFEQNEAPETVNHELRLTSSGSGPLKWQLGAFYFKENNSLLTYLQTYTDGTPYNWGIFSFPKIVAESKALFGQASYALSDTVTAEAGIRYTEDEKSRFGSLTFYGSSSPEDSHERSDATTWHLALNWQKTPLNLLYAKIDRGYKAGGFNNGSTYEPEYITAYEVGSKNSFLDRRLQLNLSAFYYDYTNQQVKQSVNLDGQSLVRELITNAGASELYGLELEGIAILSPKDRLDFSTSLLHAEYTQFMASDGNGGNVDLSGNDIQQAPKLTLTAGFQHKWTLNSGEVTGRVQSRYQTKSYLSANNYGYSLVDAYTKSDASLTYTPSSAKWEIQAYVRNIEDNRVINVAAMNSSYNSIYYQFGAPRTYGLRLSANW